MPLTLPPLSRRGFLQGSLAAAALTLAPGLGAVAAESGADPDRLLLLSDTHIAAESTRIQNGVDMHAHLKRLVEAVVASDLRPAAAFVTGDLALTSGQAGDYATLVRALRPLRAAGLPLHLGLGNHDNFERFRAAFPPANGVADPVALKQVAVVETPRANLLLLDSLDETNVAPGRLGPEQLAWLTKELDAREDKPAIVLVHHNPEAKPVNGLTDTAALYEAVVPRKQVKAICFGHTHRWSVEAYDGLHLVNLPAVAYVFQRGEPSAWVDLKLGDGRGTFTLHALDKAHPKHGEKLELPWRAGA